MIIKQNSQIELEKMRLNICMFTVIVSIFFLSAVCNIHQLRANNILPKFDVILVGTNDIHGTAYPIVLSRRDTGEKYTYGGLVYMARMIEILKKQNKGNVLYLDAGDQFQGGLQASKVISSGQIISDYFNHMDNDGSAVGNHQFDFGPDFLNFYLDKVQQNILDANLIDTSKEQLPLQKQQKSKIYKFQIKDRNPYIDPELTEIKIGVIGLSTVETPFTTSGFIDGLFPETYKFEEYKEVVIQQASKLKSQGVHAIVIVSHVGNQCTKSAEYGFWTIRNQINPIPCSMKDEIFRLLDEIPSGLIDAVVQGHRHTQSHYFYKGVPIIGAINGGFYFNTIRLRFTLDGKKAYIQDEDLLIEGPIPVCERIFDGTNKCEYLAPQNLTKAGELREWSFHRQRVYADPQLTQLYQEKYAQKMKIYEYEIASNYVSFPLTKNYSANAPLGNLITNLVANGINRKNDLKFDFVILNMGGFRTTWYPGVIRYAELYSMFPFGNDELYSFKVSGKGLKRMLQIVQNGAKRFYATWGLQQTFVNNPQKYHQLQKLRHKHLISLHQSDEESTLALQQLKSTVTIKPIEDDQIYTGVTLGFLIRGGDDFSQVVNKPDEIKLFDQTLYPIMMKNLIQMELEEMKEVDEDDLIGPNNLERIIIQKTITPSV